MSDIKEIEYLDVEIKISKDITYKGYNLRDNNI
jgi:hypothetical protein